MFFRFSDIVQRMNEKPRLDIVYGFLRVAMSISYNMVHSK